MHDIHRITFGSEAHKALDRMVAKATEEGLDISLSFASDAKLQTLQIKAGEGTWTTPLDITKRDRVGHEFPDNSSYHG